MNKSYRVALICLSFISLLNVMFVPIFDLWGGLFPESVEYNFFDVVDMLFNDSDCWDYWVVILTMSIFIPTVFMLIMSLFGNKILFLIVNVAGIINWIKQIVDYCNQGYGINEIFDYHDTCVSIGNWIAIGLFFVSFVIAICSKREVKNVKGASS